MSRADWSNRPNDCAVVVKGIGQDEEDLQDKIFCQRIGAIRPRPAIEFEALRSKFQQKPHLDAGGCKICIHQECHLIPLPDQTRFEGQVRYKSKVQKRRRCDIFVVAPAKRFLSSVRSGICRPMATNILEGGVYPHRLESLSPKNPMTSRQSITSKPPHQLGLLTRIQINGKFSPAPFAVLDLPFRHPVHPVHPVSNFCRSPLMSLSLRMMSCVDECHAIRFQD